MPLLSLIRKILAFVALFFAMATATPYSNFAYAVELTSHPECLDSLFEIQKGIHKNRNNYELNAKPLKEQLPENCKTLPFEISSRNKTGYRFILEWRDQVWQINENNEIAFLGSKTPEKKNAPHAPPASEKDGNSPSVASTALPSGAPPPRAVLATPLISARPISLPQLKPVKALAPAEKTQSCYAKSHFSSTECSDHFAKLEMQCKSEKGSPTQLCNDFKNSIDSASIDNCDDANYGRCQIHIRRLQKKCSQPLAQINPECGALTSFLARRSDRAASESGEAMAERKPSAVCSHGDGQSCAIESLQNRVKALESVNLRLQQENLDFRRTLERMGHEFEQLKTKTGIKD